MRNLKYDTSESMKEVKSHREQSCSCQGEGSIEISIYKPLMYKYIYVLTEWINNKVFCIAQGTIFNIL